MKKLLFTAFCLTSGIIMHAQIFMSTASKTTFYSYTPMENIDASSDKGNYLINTANGQVVAKVEIKSFHFKNGLMEEHFNENYMETDKEGPKDAKSAVTYPNKWATFKGKIQEAVDYKKDGTFDVTIVGNFTCHGVEKPKTVKAKMTIKGGIVTIDGSFDVPLKDHDIKVPEAVGAKIAESIKVSFNATLQEKKAK